MDRYSLQYYSKNITTHLVCVCVCVQVWIGVRIYIVNSKICMKTLKAQMFSILLKKYLGKVSDLSFILFLHHHNQSIVIEMTHFVVKGV